MTHNLRVVLVGQYEEHIGLFVSRKIIAVNQPIQSLLRSEWDATGKDNILLKTVIPNWKVTLDFRKGGDVS